MVKNPPGSAGHVRDEGLIPGSGRSPGGEHGNLLQYSCLENPTDRGAWGATVQGGHKSKDTTEVTEHAHTGLRQHRGSPQQLCLQREGATLAVRVPSERLPEVHPGSVMLQPQRGQGLLGLLWAQGPASGLGAVW